MDFTPGKHGQAARNSFLRLILYLRTTFGTGACMERCLIVFDLDTKCLEKNYQNSSWNNAYSDIRRVLNKHRFNNIQGTVYLSEIGIRQAHGTIALQEVAIRFSWFDKCVSNVQFYDLAADFNAQFIVDGITQAREAFERRLADLRQQMLLAGLSAEKVDEIVGNQKFSLENSALGEPFMRIGSDKSE
jgi:virulence-associated protein VapD